MQTLVRANILNPVLLVNVTLEKGQFYTYMKKYSNDKVTQHAWEEKIIIKKKVKMQAICSTKKKQKYDA